MFSGDYACDDRSVSRVPIFCDVVARTVLVRSIGAVGTIMDIIKKSSDGVFASEESNPCPRNSIGSVRESDLFKVKRIIPFESKTGYFAMG